MIVTNYLKLSCATTPNPTLGLRPQPVILDLLPRTVRGIEQLIINSKQSAYRRLSFSPYAATIAIEGQPRCQASTTPGKRD